MRYSKTKNIYDACVYQIKVSEVTWKSGNLFVRFNKKTGLDKVYVNQGNQLGYTSGVVIPKNASATAQTEYKMNITKGMLYTLTTLPTLDAEAVDMEF